jgi:K+-transporting ATPase c subunit
VRLTTEVGPVVSDGASRVVRCCTASAGTVDRQIDKQPARLAVDRVAALNSIPDCTTSLFALVLLVAFATRIRHKIIRKMIIWLKKGAVIKMVRKVIA